MKETIVNLPEATNAALEQLAVQTGRSPTDLIQSAIEDYLLRYQSLPRSVGMANSGLSDLSERNEELLWQES